jgi:AbrB family looped-hinge helix DNA binding protein
MNIQRGKIVSGGRLQIPADLRKQLGIEEGDSVVMEVVNNELRVRSQRATSASHPHRRHSRFRRIDC